VAWSGKALTRVQMAAVVNRLKREMMSLLERGDENAFLRPSASTPAGLRHRLR